MLGKLVGPRGTVLGPSIVGVLVGWLVCACASNVPQDKKTGGDGKIKGAKSMVLENGEAKATGIVTYPGGDRIDWKLLELPEKKRGTLEVKLQWTPPRPGLQLAFDVFDEWNDLIVSSSKKTGKKARGRNRSAVVENAKGKYFIRVYAVGRGDAGKYKLSVEFKDGPGVTIFDASKLEIPDPPKLAAIPEVIEPCDDFNFDPKKPECKKFCPSSGAPNGWPPCEGTCPKPPRIDIEACWATMPCPNPPDKKVKACKPSDWPACNKAAPDSNNPNCNVAPDPVVGRVVGREVQGNELVLRIGAGSDQGITKAWKAQVINGPELTDKPVPGGEVTIVRIDKARIIGKVKLTAGQIDANPNVKFTPAKP